MKTEKGSVGNASSSETKGSEKHGKPYLVAPDHVVPGGRRHLFSKKEGKQPVENVSDQKPTVTEEPVSP